MSLNPSGLCQCGCGQPAPIAPKTCNRRGYVKGEPRRFIAGHNAGPHTGQPLEPLERRYEVRDCGYETPCWIWLRGIQHKGYAVMYDFIGRRKSVAAHRFFFEFYKGPIPQGMEIDHLCGVRACVNPDHLEAVTHTENVRRGSHTKLSVAQTREIWERARSGERHASLAREFGVTRPRVSQISWLKQEPH